MRYCWRQGWKWPPIKQGLKLVVIETVYEDDFEAWLIVEGAGNFQSSEACTCYYYFHFATIYFDGVKVLKLSVLIESLIFLFVYT